MARERVEYDVVGKDVGGSKVFKDVGDAAAKAADQVDDLGKTAADAGDGVEQLGDKTRTSGEQAEDAGEQYRGLAADIAAAKIQMHELAQEIDRTGNFDLVKDLDRQRRELRKLMRVKDLLPDSDDDEAFEFGAHLSAQIASGLSRAGGPIAAALANVFGALPPEAQVAIGGVVVSGILAVTPVVGAAIAGAVVGGVGAGGVVGGIALAAQDARVQAAAAATGETISDTLRQSAIAFVPATVSALGQIRGEVADMGDDFERIFSSSARFVEPLTGGLTGFVDELLPGVEDAINRAGPIIDELASWGPELGDLLSDIFVDLSSRAAEGASALALLWNVFEFGARSISNVALGLAVVYGWLDKGFAILTGNTQRLAEIAAAEEKAKNEGGGFSEKLKELIGDFQEVDTTATSATAKFESFAQMVHRLSGENISAERANIALEEAIDRATAAAEKNGDGIDANNPKQRANRQALLGIADAAEAAYQKILAQTGSQDLANEATERGRKKFLETAHAMGVEEKEAKALADQLFGIPNVNRSVNVDNDSGMAAVEEFMRKWRTIKDKSVTIHGYVRWTSSGLKVPGGTILERAAGGPTAAGQTYLVGEQGPELLTMPASGYVTPNHALAAAVRDGAVGTAGGGGRMSGGIDYRLLAEAVAEAHMRALRDGVRVVLDDRSGQTAFLQSRGG